MKLYLILAVLGHKWSVLAMRDIVDLQAQATLKLGDNSSTADSLKQTTDRNAAALLGHFKEPQNSPDPDKKRRLGGYGQLTFKYLTEWWKLGNPWGGGPLMMRTFFWVLLVLQFCGPFVLYFTMRGVMLNATTMLRQKSPFAQEVANCMMLPLKFLSFFLCTTLAIMLLTSGVDKDFPLLLHIEMTCNALTALSVISIPFRVLSLVDSAFEVAATEQITCPRYLRRQERMNEISYPTNSVHSVNRIDDHGYYLFSYVWRPFYYTSLIVLSVSVLLTLMGKSLDAYFLGIAYAFLSVLMAIFGSGTLGPEIFGGVVLFLEKPFVEGDIITLDKAGGGSGGAKTDVDGSVVTGFVESIGVRSVTVRRFDMRAVTVPNSLFMRGAVANWNSRPRKLIFLEFAVSHRTPVEICRIFQDKVEYLVKNHPGVDPKQYIKAGFKGISAGLKFLIVCFNARGTKKAQVQQDLTFKIVEMARSLGIQLVFKEQSMDVTTQAVDLGSYFDKDSSLTEEQQESLEAKLGHVLPGRREKVTDPPQYSAEGEVVIRLERVTLGGREGMARSASFEASTRTKAYQIKIIPEEDGQNLTVLSRKLVAKVDSEELRFVENVGIPIVSELEAGSFGEAQRVQLLLMELSKGFESLIYNKPETIGSVSFDMLDLARRALGKQSEPHALELQSAAGKQVGTVYLQVFVPESIGDAQAAG